MHQVSSRRPMAWFNFVWFQVGWWTCILAAISQSDSGGVLTALVLVLLHCSRMSDQGDKEIKAILVSAALGIGVDSVASLLGLIHFPAHLSIMPLPLWLIGMWLLLPITFDHSMRWLRNLSWHSQSLLGFVGFPVAYYLPGNYFAVLKFTEPKLPSMILFGLAWALFLPLQLWIFEKILNQSTTSDLSTR